MIKLYGLTKRQTKLADKIWEHEFTSYEQVGEWLETLSKKDRSESIKIINLIKIELLDQLCDEMDDMSDAIDVINRIKG